MFTKDERTDGPQAREQ